MSELRLDRMKRHDSSDPEWRRRCRPARCGMRRNTTPEQIASARESRAALVRFHAGKRRAAKLQRTPPWVDMGAVRSVYEAARRKTIETGVLWTVDHELPLQGATVSGLHVHQNLRIITSAENSAKRNLLPSDLVRG